MALSAGSRRSIDVTRADPAIRDQRHWGAGTKLIVEETADGVQLKSMPVFPPSDIEAVFGALRPTGPALSIDAMNAVIADEARRRARD